MRTMKFCILIELSKERISFLYNRSDSDNGFVPFEGQGSLPLAIYCDGNNMEIGQFAVNEANKKNPNAFIDVFKKLRQGGTFQYLGKEIPNNRFLFHAIQRNLTTFFESTLIGLIGTLEQNVATMPLCFLFNADVDENERLLVKNCFDQSGYANVGVKDYDQLVIQNIHTDSKNYVCVTSNGQDLFVNIYNQQGKRLDNLLIRGQGRDPRMDVAVDKLWNSIGYNNYYLNRAQEQSLLEQVAASFLVSGKVSLNENVTFSDGNSYPVSITLHELNQLSVKDDGKAIADVKCKLEEINIKAPDCTVILQGKAAQNDYFSRMFKKEFDNVRSVDNSLRTDILESLLREVKASEYLFVDKIAVSPLPTATSSPASCPPPSPAHSEDNGLIAPTKRDERDMKMLRLGVETYIANSKIEQAYKEIAAFSSQMHARNVFAFDEDIDELLKRIDRFQEQSEVNETSLKTSIQQTQPTKRDERDIKMLRMEVATCLNNGETRKIRTIVNEFRKRMHTANVHAFDEELNSLESQTSQKAESSISTSTRLKTYNVSSKDKQPSRVQTKSRTESCDKGTVLMREEKFKEARDWFRSNNLRAMADDCTTIIRWLRFLPAYEDELQNTIAVGNKEKAKVRIKEIQEIIKLYNKHGVDTSRLSKLSDAYKRIK